MSEHLMLGGYYESIINTVLHKKEYAPAPLLSAWMQVIKQYKCWNFSLFSDYTQNLPYQKAQTPTGFFMEEMTISTM